MRLALLISNSDFGGYNDDDNDDEQGQIGDLDVEEKRTWISKSTFSPWSIFVCSSLTTAALAERLQ